MRSVMALHGWIDEWKEEQLLTRLGVEPGDMHRAVDNADWLLHALEDLSRLFKVPEMVKQSEMLRRRVTSGVSEELVELTAIQGSEGSGPGPCTAPGSRAWKTSKRRRQTGLRWLTR